MKRNENLAAEVFHLVGCVHVYTGTQRNETLTNCVTTPCMDMKTIRIPPCTGTPGQPLSGVTPVGNLIHSSTAMQTLTSKRYKLSYH